MDYRYLALEVFLSKEFFFLQPMSSESLVPYLRASVRIGKIFITLSFVILFCQLGKLQNANQRLSGHAEQRNERVFVL